MVGIPRSKGCKVCVQRRVKCDETKPLCKNCTKGGRPCPGYQNEILFRDEGPRLRQKHAKDTIVKETDDAPVVQNASAIADTPSSDLRGFLEYNLTGSPPSAEHSASSHAITNQYEPHSGSLSLRRPLYSPMMFQQQLLSAFSESIAPMTKDFLPSVMKTQWVWLQHLPGLCGTSALLDATMRAVTLVQLGRQHQKEDLVNESRSHYGTALRLLSQTLCQPVAGLSSKTLCATALLSFYEMFASSNNARWIRHAGGVGALMRQRGAPRHRNGFDREILRAYRYTLVAEAFQKGEPCLLHEPEWRKVLSQIHEDIRAERMIPDDKMILFDAGEIFFAHITESTVLCAEVDKLQSINAHTDPDQIGTYLHHLGELKRNRQALKDSNQLFEQGLFESQIMPTTHLTEDPVFPVQYRYGNLFMSIFYAGYRSTLGVVNAHILTIVRVLIQSGVLPTSEATEYINENRNLSIKTCQSVSFMLRSSFLGPFYAVFGLRFASQVFSPGEPEWDWVIEKLYDIANRYLMMARQLPWLNEKIENLTSSGQLVYGNPQKAKYTTESPCSST